ncbi:MAG: hypothetical protein AB7R77_27120 [Ilumatobacteraceae bacterium]
MLRKLVSAVLGVSMLAALAVDVVSPAVVSAAPITSDDFTSGNLASWVNVTRVTIDNTSGSPAAPSVRATASAQSAYAALNLAAPVNQVCFSTNVNVASGTDFDLFRLRTATNGAIVKAFLAGGRLGIRSDFGSTSTTSGTQLGTGWHNVELCGTVGASSTWTLYRDGAVVINNWGANTGTVGVGRVQIGDTAAKTFTANYDHVVVDQAPGDEGGAPTDTTPPTVPGTPTGSSPAAGQIQISWAASTDPSGPVTYRVYRDGGATAIGQTTNLTFTDNVAGGSSHTYTVDAVDSLNIASA